MNGRIANSKPGGVTGPAAGVDHVGDHVFVVVVRADPGGGAQVVEAQKFALADRAGAVAMCERLRAGRVVRVAPAAECTARIGSVPAGGIASMLDAAALLAEAELPTDAPAHRRAGGVLPDRAGGSVRPVLLTAWMGKGAHPRLSERTDESWTTPMAALSALRGTGAGVVLVRKDQGAVSVLLTGAERTVARVVVEDASDDDAWREPDDAVRRIVSGA